MESFTFMRRYALFRMGVQYDIRKYWPFGVTIAVNMGNHGYILDSSQIYKFYMAVSSTSYIFHVNVCDTASALRIQYRISNFTIAMTPTSSFVCHLVSK